MLSENYKFLGPDKKFKNTRYIMKVEAERVDKNLKKELQIREQKA